MKNKKIIACIIVLSLALNATVLPSDAKQTLTLKNVSNSKKILYVGDTFKVLTNLSVKKVSFTSSKKKVATISSKGVITAKKVGKTTITVKTTAGIKKRFTLTVRKPNMYSVNRNSGTYVKNTKITLKALSGYNVYYTTNGTFTSSKVVKSGKSKKITLEKSTTLQIYPIKKTKTLSTKYLNANYSSYEYYASYQYTVIDLNEIAATAAPTIQPTEQATKIPSVTEKPTITEEPIVTDGPTITEEPIVTDGPTITEEPIVTDGPTITEEPIATDGPTITEEPIATDGPTITEEPIATDGPTITEEPIATDGPTITEEPIVTDGPIITEEPSITEEPIVTDGPTITEEPIVTDGPTITEEPSITSEPTATPSLTDYVEPNRAEYKKPDSKLGSVESENQITLSNDRIEFTGEGAEVSGSTITITSAGTYVVSGTLENGQIIVNIPNAGDDDKVYLVLNNANIHCETNAAVNLISADKVILTLAEGTVNTITDGSQYILEEGNDEPDAPLYSKVALSINGTGTLNVIGNYGDGIKCKDNLRIVGGIINVTASDDGIVGRDMLGICGGTITVTSGGDGLKSTHDTKSTKGYIDITGGTITIHANGDGMQAETSIYIDESAANTNINIKTSTTANTTTDDSLKGIKAKVTLVIAGGNFTIETADDGIHSDGWVYITGGTIYIQAAGDGIKGETNVYCDNVDITITTSKLSTSATDISLKGIKATTTVTILGGTYQINTVDDGIHSNGSIYITGGDITISSSDDGIHADETLLLEGGDIDITKSYEGIEGNSIYIEEDTILHLVSSDDGINAAGKSSSTDSSSSGRPGSWNPGQNMQSSNSTLNINGGYVCVDASGDGIDVNGTWNMTGGTIIVNGPTSSGNGALDYDNTFNISGGIIVAVGSSGMAQGPSTTSEQVSIQATFSNTKSANTILHLEDAQGNNIITFSPSKSYQSIVISSPELAKGSSYKLYSGGTAEGIQTDGLYTQLNQYTNGTLEYEFSLTDTVTSVGNGSQIGPGQGSGGGNQRPW